MPLRKLRYARRLLTEVLPLVDRELEGWQARAQRIPDPVLRRQALSSIAHKRFHCEGGAVYALFVPPHEARRLVRLIVALQTISDYLDNLCDRSTSLLPRDYRGLHTAMLDAVLPGPAAGNYYRHHPQRGDGGYLDALVNACKQEVASLAGYDAVVAHVWRLVSLYCDLQVLKHAPVAERERLLRAWYRRHRHLAAGLRWNEFAAAAGSTLGVFVLFAAAARRRPEPQLVSRLLRAYFPWVCALHILLDYWIDQQEDERGGDLNFTAYYKSPAEASARLRVLLRRSLQGVRRLPDAALHEVIVQGLPALYLSDGKSVAAGIHPYGHRLLHEGGLASRVVYVFCRLWRRGRVQDGVQAPPLVPRI